MIFSDASIVRLHEILQIKFTLERKTKDVK
jgi:hypothetical protein